MYKKVFKNPDSRNIFKFFIEFNNININIKQVFAETNIHLSAELLEMLETTFGATNSPLQQGVKLTNLNLYQELADVIRNDKAFCDRVGSFTIFELICIFMINPFVLHNLYLKDILNLLKYCHNIVYVKTMLCCMFPKTVVAHIDELYTKLEERKFHLRIPDSEKALVINCKVIAAMFQQYHRHLCHMGAVASLEVKKNKDGNLGSSGSCLAEIRQSATDEAALSRNSL